MLWNLKSRITAAFTQGEGTRQDGALARLIEAEQVQLLYLHAPTALLSMVFSAAGLFICSQDFIPISLLLTWFAFVGVVTASRAFLIYRYRRRPPSLDEVPRWRRFFVLGAGAAGLVWFSAGAMLFSQTSSSQQFELLFILSANAAGSVAFLSPVFPAFLSFFLPILTIITFRVVLVSHTPIVMGALALFFTVAFVSTARRLSLAVTHTLRLRFKNSALVQDLQTLTERFELAVQGTNEGVWDASFVTSAPGQFVAKNIYYSPRFKELLGFADHEFPHTSTSWQERLHPQDRAGVLRALYGHLTRKTPYSIEHRLRTKTGAYRWFLGGGQAVWDEADNPVRMAGSLHDITARKEAEQLKDELVSTVSHELRTPLTSLRGFAELMLQRSFSPEKQRQFLSIIHKEATRLTELINDFLDLQRMESGRQVYSFTTGDLAPLLREVAAVFMNSGGQHIFHLDIAVDLLLVRIDADRIRQVLMNLLSNAVKYSPQGGTIRFGARHESDSILTWVADQGVGIPPEAQSQLFSKFFRVNNQDTRSIGGTGLGLALVKDIIEAHEGRVWVESEVGVGSTFFFTLPRVDSAEAAAPAPHEAA